MRLLLPSLCSLTLLLAVPAGAAESAPTSSAAFANAASCPAPEHGQAWQNQTPPEGAPHPPADCPPHHGKPPHMPPPEPPLAAVKACVGKKTGAKTVIYLHGDSIPAICEPYDGMLLAKPLHPPGPPQPPAHPEAE